MCEDPLPGVGGGRTHLGDRHLANGRLEGEVNARGEQSGEHRDREERALHGELHGGLREGGVLGELRDARLEELAAGLVTHARLRGSMHARIRIGSRGEYQGEADAEG